MVQQDHERESAISVHYNFTEWSESAIEERAADGGGEKEEDYQGG